MSRQFWITLSLATAIALISTSFGIAATSSNEPHGKAVDLFRAMAEGQAEVTFIAKSDAEARLLITNNTKQPLKLQLPSAFAGVPVLPQFGGGGAGGGRGGGGRGGGGGGGQQAVGGGMGGGMMGGGGGGGFFSVPPEQTAKLNVAVVCLDHGLRDPSSSKPYKIVPAHEHIDRPEVVELLQAFGRGELDHAATQAATWHLNSDVSWNELAAKLTGTRRSPSRSPYFSREQIQAGMAYAAEAARLAEINREAHEQEAAKYRKEADSFDSDQRSTTEVANEPEAKVDDSDAEIGQAS